MTPCLKTSGKTPDNRMQLKRSDVSHLVLHANLTNTSRRAKRDKSHQFKRVLQDSVFLAGDYYNQIWKPDLYFPDAVELKRPIIEADDSLQLQVDKDGNFLYSMRLIVQTRCSLRMTYFPLDQQECPICISHVSLIWMSKFGHASGGPAPSLSSGSIWYLFTTSKKDDRIQNIL